MSQDRDELITVTEAGRRTGLHRRTIQRLIEQGRIAGVEVPATVRLVRAADLQQVQLPARRTRKGVAARVAA